MRFNGGLFAESQAFELTEAQLAVLLQAGKRDWRNVEPAIFGTLLERALDTRERSKLGAHYTPRSYVERLVKPVVMEPLRDRWITVQGEVKQLLNAGEKEPTANQKKKAIAVLDINQVNPSQFLGIEINPRAAAIADLVIWIGYLQWHFRRFGDLPPIEPVLREYNNRPLAKVAIANKFKPNKVHNYKCLLLN